MNLTILWCGSLNGCFVLATISRTSNFFLWLFNSSSTLKNPAQYKTIPNAEMVVEKEGKRWFWADVILMGQSQLNKPCLSEDLMRELVTWSWCCFDHFHSLLILQDGKVQKSYLSWHMFGRKDQYYQQKGISWLMLFPEVTYRQGHYYWQQVIYLVLVLYCKTSQSTELN